jgi:hypothetical protein
MSNNSTQFQEILNAAKEKRGDLPVDTMIVSSHLAQMRLFILRRGVEFFCDQDSYGGRREFLKKVYESNMLEMKLDSIIDYFLCDGQGLFYFRPSGDTYQLLYFPKEQYRCYRDQNGEIEHVELIYTFAVKEPNLMDVYAMTGKRGGRKKYIKLKVFKDRIEQTISNEKLEFENGSNVMTMQQPGQTETLSNSLGFIPAVEVFNHLDCTGESTGTGEFDWMANQILFHDELVRNVRKNMKFFGNPTLVSSRPRHDILESGDEGSMRPTISSQAGFYAMDRPSTRTSAPGFSSSIDGQIKVPRVIANLEPTDRVSYMTPDAVSGDQNMYVKQYRSEIRLALGGVDDLDFNMASSAYEMKSLYGRCAATAEKKAKALFEYGLCKLFALMIQHEEYLFEQSFATAMGLKNPEPPLPEQFEDSEEFEKAQVKYQKEQKRFLDTRAKLFSASIESGEIPNGVTGLIPDGSSKVNWRWTGEIFEEDSQGILNNSIVVRNLQELGVDSIEALKYLFPSKTDEERAAMLTGFPFRMVQQSQQAFNTFTQMIGTLYQLPHPQMPNQPLAADPNLDITGFLYRSLDFLRKELSYSGKYKPDDGDRRPNKLSDADRKRSQLGLPTRDERPIQLPGSTSGTYGATSSNGLPVNGLPAGFGGPGSSSESLAGSIPSTQRKPEYAASLPGPGVVLGVSNTDSSGQYPGQLGVTRSATMGEPGAADLRSPSFNPGIFGPGAQSNSTAGNRTAGTSGSGTISKPKPKRSK